MASTPRLSIVAPVFNEAAILEELAERCVRAGRATHRSFEVLLVDDASNDDTRTAAAGLRPPVRVLHLAANVGQLGATLEGLRAVVNLDTVGRLSAGELTALATGTAMEWPHVFRGITATTGVPIRSIAGARASICSVVSEPIVRPSKR